MLVFKKVLLKDKTECNIRSAVSGDAAGMLECMDDMLSETDNLMFYPDEFHMTEEEEKVYLDGIAESTNSILVLAESNGEYLGNAVIRPVQDLDRFRHRAELGISVLKKYWHKGVGKAMISVLLDKAPKMGYEQVELNVVEENTNAIKLYESVGFKEFGRNTHGFKMRDGSYKALIYMKKDF